MHPTATEQLQGVLRWLDAVAADPGLSSASAERLADATRVLRRLETSGPARMPFLLADNVATETLLAELGVTVTSEPTPTEQDAHARNLALRALLTSAIADLPVGADDSRRRIGAHLRNRVAADPSLNRNPRSPGSHNSPSSPYGGPTP